MKQTEIRVMNTLDKFGQREMVLLIELLNAYNHANSFHNGKRYAAVPDSWDDSGVYADFNAYSGLVFLTNDDYRTLVNTEYGVGMLYYTPYAGYEGTLFELADQINDALTDKDGNVVAASDSGWHIDDLNYMWQCFDDDAAAFADTGADLRPIHMAQMNILKAIALDKLDILAAMAENETADALITATLKDFEHELVDADDNQELADFIYAELAKQSN